MSDRLSRAVLAVALLGLGASCLEDLPAVRRMDGPTDIAVLPPGIFEVPVGFVTNFRSGHVSKLDLKRTGHLVEDGPAPWMGGPEIPLGRDRALSEIALVYGSDFVHVWAADDVADELVRASYIDGIAADGTPQWTRPELGEVTVTDHEGNPWTGDATPELLHLRARPGKAAPEVWTLVWQGSTYRVHGSTAGPQINEAVPGTPYRSDAEEVAFTVMRPLIGDTFTDDEFRTLIADAYASFGHTVRAPMVQLAPNHFLLELFHGPTLAFKDFAM